MAENMAKKTRLVIEGIDSRTADKTNNPYWVVKFKGGTSALCWEEALVMGVNLGDTVDVTIESRISGGRQTSKITSMSVATETKADVDTAPNKTPTAASVSTQKQAVKNTTPASPKTATKKEEAPADKPDSEIPNLRLYNQGREVPESAKKPIGGGRLKGMTNVNTMWRIKKLTEMFGPVGIGWKTVTLSEELVEGTAGEMVVKTSIHLFVKADGVWSEPIEGSGGAKLIVKENGGLFTDDEAYKKAYSDAISVACKSLGIGADVYYEQDTNKYE